MKKQFILAGIITLLAIGVTGCTSRAENIKTSSDTNLTVPQTNLDELKNEVSTLNFHEDQASTQPKKESSQPRVSSKGKEIQVSQIPREPSEEAYDTYVSDEPSEETSDVYVSNEPSEGTYETYISDEPSEETSFVYVPDEPSKETSDVYVPDEPSEETSDVYVFDEPSKETSDVYVFDESSEETSDVYVFDESSEETSDVYVSDEPSEETSDVYVSDETSKATPQFGLGYGICCKDCNVTLADGQTYPLYRGQQVAIHLNSEKESTLDIVWYPTAGSVPKNCIEVYPDSYIPDFSKGQWVGFVCTGTSEPPHRKVLTYGICKKNCTIKVEQYADQELYQGQQVGIAYIDDESKRAQILWYNTYAWCPLKNLEIYPNDYTPDFTRGQWAGVITN